MLSFFNRHLEPVESLSEILFGLIMVLTVTLGARLVAGSEPLQGADLVRAAVGCNIAWGVIDAALYVLGNRFSRNQAARLARAVRTARDKEAALGLVRSFLDARLGAYGRPEDREAVYRSLNALIAHAEPAHSGITADDLRGGFAVFLLVVATAVPAAIPFLVIADPMVALRVSNLSLVSLMFVVGFLSSRHAGGSGWRVGFAMMVLGLALTGIAIALGG